MSISCVLIAKDEAHLVALSITKVADSWRPRGVSPWSGSGYGYGWFASEAAGYPVHFAWGYGGQMLHIVPSLNLTLSWVRSMLITDF